MHCIWRTGTGSPTYHVNEPQFLEAVNAPSMSNWRTKMLALKKASLEANFELCHSLRLDGRERSHDL
jgi:hypothetical protein